MKAILWPTLALSFFPSFGNGQVDAVSTPPPAAGRGTQGNVAWSQAQRESELDQAALAARQKKALMQSMATVAHKPPVITSAAQYLEVHKAPAPAPGESAASSPVRRDAYVPTFESATSNSSERRSAGPGDPMASAPATSSPSFAEEEKKGLFQFFKKREKDGDGLDSTAPRPPAAAYPDTSAGMTAADPSPGPGSEGSARDSGPGSVPAPPSPREEAVADATQGGSDSETGSFFSRLFRRKGGAADSAAPDSVGSSTAAPSAPLVPEPAPPALPSAPSTPSAPAMSSSGGGGSSSIFVPRAAAPDSGATTTVLTATQATVAGVLVTLYEGTQVAILERDGGVARIRLPDGREGTIPANALAR